MWQRLRTLIVKELVILLRARQTRMIVLVPVLMQVLVFPFAATLEVTDASIGVYSEDAGEYSHELIQRLGRARAFSQMKLLRSPQEIEPAVNNQEILLLVRFPADFSRNLASGAQAEAQVILDGRRSNSAQIAAGYIQDIFMDYQLELLKDRGAPAPESQLVVRNWYNPNLDYKWFVLPSLIALITTIGVLILTSLSVAREREQGTLEQLLVSPLATWQIFIGKAVPALIIAFFQGSVVLLAGIFFYDIPFAGSIPLFYFCMMVYGLSLIGFGLFISALCATQQQAFIGVFMFMLPGVLLSGYIAPVENMPLWLQRFSMVNPIRHFTEITKQIYLKNADFETVWHSLAPLLIIAVVTSSVAYLLFRRKIS